MPTVNYRDSQENKERRRENLARQNERREQNRQQAIRSGRIAWDNLLKTGAKNIGIEDRQTIARQLGKLTDEYHEQKQLGKKGTLLEEAGLAPNDWEKLITKPGRPTSTGLKARPYFYREFILALAKRVNEDKDFLADCILSNTSFYPIDKNDLDEAKLILAALEVAIDQIDQEYKIWEQCEALATIREPLEKSYFEAVGRGDYDFARSELPMRVRGDSVTRWWPLDEFWLDTGDEPIVPKNAFWVRSDSHDLPFAAGVVGEESFFYFPHVYLGPAMEWTEKKPDVLEGNFLWLEMNTGPEPVFRFESGLYSGYRIDPATGQEQKFGIDDIEWEFDGLATTARWLVIYPDPLCKRLIPAIFTKGEMFFTELVPLTPRLIVEFGDLDRWQSRDGSPSLLQRLRNLTGYGTGDFGLMNAWRETAARFHLNPIFRNQPDVSNKILYRRHLEKWINENRVQLKVPTER